MKNRCAKVFIVNALHPGEVLILEKERDDLPGGSGECGEKPKRTAKREAREELPGARIFNFIRIPSELVRSLGESGTKEIVFYAALVELPLDDHGNEVLSVTSEHSGARWERRDSFLHTTVPQAYKLAALAGECLFQELERNHALQLGIPILINEDMVLTA